MNYSNKIDILIDNIKPFKDMTEYVSFTKETKNEELKLRILHCMARILLFTVRYKIQYNSVYIDQMNSEKDYIRRAIEKGKIFPHPGIEGNRGNRPIQLDMEEEKKIFDTTLRLIYTYI